MYVGMRIRKWHKATIRRRKLCFLFTASFLAFSLFSIPIRYGENNIHEAAGPAAVLAAQSTKKNETGRRSNIEPIKRNMEDLDANNDVIATENQ